MRASEEHPGCCSACGDLDRRQFPQGGLAARVVRAGHYRNFPHISAHEPGCHGDEKYTFWQMIWSIYHTRKASPWYLWDQTVRNSCVDGQKPPEESSRGGYSTGAEMALKVFQARK